jgi:hypothetical protein
VSTFLQYLSGADVGRRALSWFAMLANALAVSSAVGKAM